MSSSDAGMDGRQLAQTLLEHDESRRLAERRAARLGIPFKKPNGAAAVTTFLVEPGEALPEAVPTSLAAVSLDAASVVKPTNAQPIEENPAKPVVGGPSGEGLKLPHGNNGGRPSGEPKAADPITGGSTLNVAGISMPAELRSEHRPGSIAGQTIGAGLSDDIAAFMARVVPWPSPGEPGYINLHYTVPNRDGMPGRPYTDLQSFLGFARWAASKPDIMKEIYFCLTRQSATTTGKTGKPQAVRNAQNATHAKALWIDADVKPDQPEKNYTSTSALVTALAKFLVDASLPPPSALIMSGSGGMHIYWISDRPLTITEWQPYAQGLSSTRCQIWLQMRRRPDHRCRTRVARPGHL